jgi:diguanylate cyclase (GGDEF)-like protein/PAS domain S-box-containing protein
LNMSVNPERRALLELAQKENTVVLSPPLVLRSTGKIGLLAYMPVYQETRLLGFLNAGIPFEAIAKTVLPPSIADQYHLALGDIDSNVFFLQDEKANMVRLDFPVLNRRYRLALSPKTPLGSVFFSRLTVLGLFFSAAMALLLYSLLRRHRQLAESEARFRDLADLLPDAVLECSSNFQITYANQAAQKLLPQLRSTGLSKLSNLVSPEDWEVLAHRFQHMVDDGESIHNLAIRIESAQSKIVELSANVVLHDVDRIGYRMVLRDITEKLQTEEQLYRMANYDALTGLPNRSFFYDYLTHVLKRAERQRTRFAVLFSDLDRFKYINDSLGHHVGDLLLQEAANRMLATLRRSDTIARLGGDEFTIIIEDIKDPADAARAAQKIIDVLTQPFEIEGKTLVAGTSVGIAIYPDDGTTIEDLLRKADTAMYEAKRSGGNRYHFYAKEINQKIDRYIDLEAGLREAIQKKQFVLYYQPLLDPQGLKLVALEALIRWQKPGAGLVMPGQFIPFAEESGLIVPIGEWVLNEALEQMKRWQDQGVSDIYMAINLSAKQLDKGLIIGQLQEAFIRTGVDPKNIVIEITESTLMHAENGEQVLHELKALGVRIALDDFGTGYSSLAYLSNLPIDIVKIDRSFIIPIPDAIRNAVIVHAVVELAKKLQLQVVAEGVETEGQKNFLQTEGHVLLQGYLFSPPLPVHEVERLLIQKDTCANEM